MEKQTNLEKEWIRSLGSGDPGLTCSAIYEIRNSGSVKMLPYLFDLIHQETPIEVRNEIFKLLGEIKSPEAVPVIVECLERKDFGEFLPSFIAACWQSGLDFSNHLRIFAELFIHGDYITSLESFTLLEEAFPNANDDARISCIRYIRDSEHLVLDEKLPLFRELRRVIEGI
jgi:hypothetical protein